MRTRAGELALRVVTIIGLLIDAVIHIQEAPDQPPASSGQISQTTLFYLESAASIVVVVLLIFWATRWSYLAAAAVTASAVGAVLLSRYHDIGAIGPIPDLYEPMWYASKVQATIAEVVALVTSLAGSALLLVGRTAPANVIARRHHVAAAH